VSKSGLFRRRIQLKSGKDSRIDVQRSFNFNEADHEDLSNGPTVASVEGQRSILNHRWVWMGIVIFVIGALIHNQVLLAITAFMLITVAISWLWSRSALGGVRYERKFHHQRAFPGESVTMTIIVENRKPLPVTWLQIEDEWPINFGPADESILMPGISEASGFLVNVYTLRWYERIKRHYLLIAKARGIYPVGPAHLISGDPFSLFERGAQAGKSSDEQNGRRYAYNREMLIVYPLLKPLAELQLQSNDPFGDQAVLQRLFEDPLHTIGVRDYAPGDGFRHIHWKATARGGVLQVRQYEPARALSVSLCLNIASFEQHWRGTWSVMIEHLISIAASVAEWSLTKGYAVGLTANAPLSQSDQPLRIAPGRSPDQLMNILELLAGISYFVTQDYAQFVLAESPRLPWGTTLVLITGYVNESLLAAVEQVRASGRRIAMITVGVQPPPTISGVPAYHLAVNEDEPETTTK